ncbi:DUF4389 domain-containing protein [Candidatus Halocynthiibacter alkanivorans]|uniref:DUF4389 domain-containing protein n=1 Tax=Candidatus Halocynthiibacter alkanivorans TaxID=2267619 RepID=UPI000DF40353|nr:DUF4389 domain-containing protein [Candidatus Halocynthiibacter alkanivorans]
MSDPMDRFEDEDDGFERDAEIFEPRDGVWMRGLWMLVVAFLLSVARFVTLVAALIQFGWMLFAGEKNDNITAFGISLARWTARAVLFLTGASEEKPYPWRRWP